MIYGLHLIDGIIWFWAIIAVIALFLMSFASERHLRWITMVIPSAVLILKVLITGWSWLAMFATPGG